MKKIRNSHRLVHREFKRKKMLQNIRSSRGTSSFFHSTVIAIITWPEQHPTGTGQTDRQPFTSHGATRLNRLIKYPGINRTNPSARSPSNYPCRFWFYVQKAASLMLGFFSDLLGRKSVLWRWYMAGPGARSVLMDSAPLRVPASGELTLLKLTPTSTSSTFCSTYWRL